MGGGVGRQRKKKKKSCYIKDEKEEPRRNTAPTRLWDQCALYRNWQRSARGEPRSWAGCVCLSPAQPNPNAGEKMVRRNGTSLAMIHPCHWPVRGRLGVLRHHHQCESAIERHPPCALHGREVVALVFQEVRSTTPRIKKMRHAAINGDAPVLT